MRIGLCVVATGRYIEFIEALWQSAAVHFLPGHERTLFVFTDSPERVPTGAVPVVTLHTPWPGPTLHRHRILLQSEAQLSPLDYIFQCDADMRFVGRVGDEILGPLTATLHPGFYRSHPDLCSYERRPESLAFIPYGAGRHYFAGGFQGGAAPVYLKAAAELARRVEQDACVGVTATWHDESHWNRLLLDRPPEVILSPSYCYPEGWSLEFEPRLLALNKDHAVFQC